MKRARQIMTLKEMFNSEHNMLPLKKIKLKHIKTIKFFTYSVFILFLGIAISSCTGDDGADGTAGADGQDGNANVISVTFPNVTIAVGNHLFSVPELTQSIFDTGVVLGYVQSIGQTKWVPLPFVTNPPMHMEIESFELGEILVHSSLSGVFNFRFILIESSTNKNGKSTLNSRQEIYTELKNAGININDYHDVCDYYGINP